MCTTCGCGGHAEHSHHNGHGHHHHHGADGALQAAGEARLVEIEEDILGQNAAEAEQNRALFAANHVLALNLVSSPGTGKTCLLVETLRRYDGASAVIEGDQETSADATRIRETGKPAIQINTGRGCHLDAKMVGHAYDHLDKVGDAILFIENVGNLVCPAAFDLGEDKRVVMVSVTEGEDKPLKYPHIFASADLMLVTKTDLLPHLDFDLSALMANARKVSPKISTIQLSSKSGEGMDRWIAWLKSAQAMKAITA